MKLYIFKIPVIDGKSAWHESCYYSRFQIPYSINGIFIEPIFWLLKVNCFVPNLSPTGSNSDLPQQTILKETDL